MPRRASRGDLRVELAHRDVVEEDDRLGALDHQVVHDHRHAVDADRVVASDLGGQLELGADAVRGGDEDRVLVAVGRLEHAGEAADRAQDFGPEGGLGDLLHLVDEGFVVIEIHTGGGVARERTCW